MSNDKAMVVSTGFVGLGDLDEKALIDAAKSAADERGSASAESIREGMGNSAPKLERFKLKHGGNCVILDAAGKRYEELTGVVVAFTYRNVFFDKPFEEHTDGEMPACFSHDAVTISPRAMLPQAANCAVCPRNRDAREKAAREAAFDRDRKECCGNYLSFAIGLPRREVPVMLQVSQASFKGWAEYVQGIGTRGRFQPHEVLTRMKLVNQKKGGSEFTLVQFEMVGPLPAPVKAQVAANREGYLAVLRREVAAEESAGEAAAPADTASAAVKAARASGSTQAPL